MSKKMSWGIALAIVFQIAVLVGMYWKAQLPFWFGQELHVKTLPVDPRSLFRGNYARLNYDFSRIKRTHFPKNLELRVGELIYIGLKPSPQKGKSSNHLYAFDKVYLQKPDTGVFLRGRIKTWSAVMTGQVRIHYGIEAFFAPKEKALALEKELRDGGVAVIMVNADGQVALKDVRARLKEQ